MWSAIDDRRLVSASDVPNRLDARFACLRLHGAAGPRDLAEFLRRVREQPGAKLGDHLARANRETPRSASDFQLLVVERS